MADLKDVADHAGVSISTVSRVLNHPDMVNAKTRQRVERSIRKLDYQPNRVARRLSSKGGKAHIIGFIIPDIENSFYSSIVRGVENVAYTNDYAVILCNSGEDAERENYYLNVLRGESVDGIVLPPIPENRVAATNFKQIDIPTVCFDRQPEEGLFDTVVTDNRRSTRTAIEHLIRLGHERIAIICGSLNLYTSVERLNGFKDAFHKHGLEIVDDFIASSDVANQSDRELGFQLAEKLLDLPDRPTAVFTSNNQITLGALRSIRGRGLHVPDDVALVGFDDTEWAEFVDPPLTAIRQPSYELGRRAAEMLLQRIKDPSRPPAVITLPSSLIVRASCGMGKVSATRTDGQ